VFELDQYKDILVKKIESNRDVRGYQKKIATACGCHTSFISQVVNSHLHLTPDHAANLCHFWGLTELESEYFSNLVDLERSSSVVLQKKIKSRISTLKKRNKTLSERLVVDTESEENSAKEYYYSSWQIMAIHVCCSLPKKNTASNISDRLKLPIEFVNRTLNELCQRGYLDELDDGYHVTDKDLHLKSDSSLVCNHHRNWRSFAMSKFGEDSQESIHYSTLFAMSRADYNKLQQMMIDFINDSRDIVKSSKEEELYYLNLDFALV